MSLLNIKEIILRVISLMNMSSVELGTCSCKTRLRNLPRKDSCLLVLIKNKETSLLTARAIYNIKMKNSSESDFFRLKSPKVVYHVYICVL